MPGGEGSSQRKEDALVVEATLTERAGTSILKHTDIENRGTSRRGSAQRQQPRAKAAKHEANNANFTLFEDDTPRRGKASSRPPGSQKRFHLLVQDPGKVFDFGMSISGCKSCATARHIRSSNENRTSGCERPRRYRRRNR